MRHVNYLLYVLRHKWFVLVASIKLGSSVWRALIHDLSKFRPSEWFPYAETFYAPDGSNRYQETYAFADAWNAHQKRNKHHWQYWILLWDRGTETCIQMPNCYVLEMVADWMGAGKAITGRWEVGEWYEKNKQNIRIHDRTREKVEMIISML